MRTIKIDEPFAKYFLDRRNRGYKDWFLEDLFKKELSYQLKIPKEQLKVEDRLAYEVLSVKTTDDLVSMSYHVIIEDSYSSTIVKLANDIDLEDIQKDVPKLQNDRNEKERFK